MNENIKCSGCGAILQTESNIQMGYSPKISEETKLCQRCFKIKNYNTNTVVEIDESDFGVILDQINLNKSSVVLLVDVFDFYGSVRYIPNEIKQSRNLSLVLNKVDLLPMGIKKHKIVSWAKKLCEEYGIYPENIIPYSATKKLNNNALKDIVEDSKFKKVYVIGMTNVGKSSLIQNLLEEADVKPVVSHFPNTTLSSLELSYRNKTIIDTPGLRNKGNFIERSDSSDLKSLMTKNRYKPMTFQLNSGQTLFLDRSIRVDFSFEAKTGVTVYVPNNIYIHRTKTSNADDLEENEKLFNLKTVFDSRTRQTFRFNKQKRYTITISGLGFFSFKSTATTNIEIFAPDDILIYEQEVLI